MAKLQNEKGSWRRRRYVPPAHAILVPGCWASVGAALIGVMVGVPGWLRLPDKQ